MTFETLQTLVEFLPEHLLRAMYTNERPEYKAGDSQAHNLIYDHHVERLMICYGDMEFGWNFVRVLADNRLPFPGGLIVGDDEMLFRAYMYRANGAKYGTEAVRGAVALTTPYLANTCASIQGLLLAPGADAQSVANLVGLSRDIVAAYEKLFFNVLDRKDDLQYLQRIVYPHGRMVELMDNYLQRETMGALARRAGFNNGAADVLFFMGASNSALDALLQAASAKQLESMMMAFGLLLARNGGLNQASLPAISNARQLLTAGKLGGEVNQDQALSADLSETLRREISQYARAVDVMS